MIRQWSTGLRSTRSTHAFYLAHEAFRRAEFDAKRASGPSFMAGQELHTICWNNTTRGANPGGTVTFPAYRMQDDSKTGVVRGRPTGHVTPPSRYAKSNEHEPADPWLPSISLPSPTLSCSLAPSGRGWSENLHNVRCPLSQLLCHRRKLPIWPGNFKGHADSPPPVVVQHPTQTSLLGVLHTSHERTRVGHLPIEFGTREVETGILGESNQQAAVAVADTCE